MHQTEFGEFDAFNPYETDVDLCITLGGTCVGGGALIGVWRVSWRVSKRVDGDFHVINPDVDLCITAVVTHWMGLEP